jgi:hypothetical protein
MTLASSQPRILKEGIERDSQHGIEVIANQQDKDISLV